MSKTKKLSRLWGTPDKGEEEEAEMVWLHDQWPCKDHPPGNRGEAEAYSERNGRPTMMNGNRNLSHSPKHWPTTVKSGQD